MSDTPKTDAAIINFEYEETWLGGERGGGSKEIIEPDFCRSIERSHNAMISKLEALVENSEHGVRFCYNEKQVREKLQMACDEITKIIQEAKQ